MAAQAADYQRPYRGHDPRNDLLVPLAGATAMSGAHVIYKGCPVAQDVSVADGYVRQVGTGVTWASGDVFEGVALEHQTVAAGQLANGVVSIRVARNGSWAWPKASVAQGDVGAPAYLSEDNALTTSSSNTLWIGLIEAVDSVSAWIRIDAAVGRANTAT